MSGVDVVAAMVRDATDAEKFRIANQHAISNVERIELRWQSDAARAVISELIAESDKVARYLRELAAAGFGDAGHHAAFFDALAACKPKEGV